MWHKVWNNDVRFLIFRFRINTLSKYALSFMLLLYVNSNISVVYPVFPQRLYFWCLQCILLKATYISVVYRVIQVAVLFLVCIYYSVSVVYFLLLPCVLSNLCTVYRVFWYCTSYLAVVYSDFCQWLYLSCLPDIPSTVFLLSSNLYSVENFSYFCPGSFLSTIKILLSALYSVDISLLLSR